MSTLRFSTPLLLLALSACAVGPDYTAPPSVEDLSLTDIVEDQRLISVAGMELEAAWWTRFNDPVLTALIDKAADRNTDIKLAIFRIEEARAERQIVGAARRPIVSGTSSVSRLQGSETAGGLGPPPGAQSLQNLFGLSLNFNWELDIFGRLKRYETAADARIQATEEERRAIMVAVFAEVGIAYADLRGLQLQYEIAGRNIEIVSQTLDLTGLLADQGLAPEFDLVRARADVTELVARRNQLLAGQRRAVARIAFLTGQHPSDLMTDLLSDSPQLIPSGRIPVGLPSDILRRRADIRAAERRLAAASEQIGIETADLFPRFSLTGTAGLSSANLEDLFEAGSQTWSISGASSWPFLNTAASRAEIDIARSQFGAAGVQYDAAILGALQDVETALTTYVFTAKELDGLIAARADRERAYELALLRYRSNTDTLFPALNAGQRLTALNAEIAGKQQDILIAEINVYRALGGGWQAFED